MPEAVLTLWLVALAPSFPMHWVFFFCVVHCV